MSKMPVKKTVLNSTGLNLFQDRTKYYEDCRRKRNDVTVELRKALRDDQIKKHRNLVLADDEFEDFKPAYDMTITDIKEGLLSKRPMLMLSSLRSARKMLSLKKCSPIDDFINADILPILMDYLTSKYNDRTEYQYECAWIITNIASGTSQNTFSIVEVGAIPLLIELLKSPDVRVMEQAVWALGNIAGDGPKLRDIIIASGIIPILCGLLKKAKETTAKQNIVWTISNLCRNKNPPPDFNCLLPCIPMLVNMLYQEDSQVVSNACWALSYLTDGSNEKIQVIIDAGTLSIILKYLRVEDTNILLPALRVVGNIVSGTDAQTKHALDHGILHYLHKLLSHKRISIMKDAAWLLSNVLAGSIEQIQAVIDQNLLPILVNTLKQGDLKVQKEAAWAINNLFSGGSADQVALLAETGVLEPYCRLLLSQDSRMVEIILEGLSQLLERSVINGTQGKYCLLIEEASGLDHLEALQNHASQKIYEMSFTIVEKYFQAEDNYDGLNFNIRTQDMSPSSLFDIDS